MCERSDSLGAREGVDEVLHLFVLKGGAEVVEYYGVGCGEDEFVLLWVVGVEEEPALDLPVVVRDVALANRILERGEGLLHLDAAVHFVTYK